MYILIILTALILTRVIEYKLFIKRTLRACHLYDCKYAATALENFENPSMIVEMLNDGYERRVKWSAFRFVMFEGPSMISMFLSFKPLTIKRQYDKRVVNKLNEYAIA
jgi:hypothetical protein